MPLLKPQDLEPEMVLSADVSNLDGQILFKKGVILMDRQIEILQMWGIAKVEVEGDGPEEDLLKLDRYPEATIKRAEEIVSRKFKLVKSSHPAVETIKRMCILNTAKTIHKQSS